MAEEHLPNQVPTINELVRRWMETPGSVENPGSTLDYGATRNLLDLLSRKLYADYQPFPEGPQFLERLARWLDNLRDDEAAQQLLFKFVPWLLFIGRKEMETMYRAAFTGPISRWIIEDAKLDIADPDLPEKFGRELNRTWFGSLAGMDIGSFMRINGIDEQGLRPDFRVLSYFVKDPSLIRSYLSGTERRSQPYLRIVAVEDVVGTGTQMKTGAKVLQALTDIKILICPIVAASKGVKVGKQIAAESPHIAGSPHITFREYFQIPDRATIPRTPMDGEPHFLAKLRDMIYGTWPRLENGSYGDGPFGFSSPDSVEPGSLVLTFLNCPNNVPPFVHRSMVAWEPLFPRLVRET